MYANNRKSKEPEVNTMKTGSMSTWNTGESAIKSLQKEQLTQATTIDKKQAINEIVRKYQDNQYTNYMNFIAELGMLGYCAMPSAVPDIIEVAHVDCVNENGSITANTTYGDYRRRMAALDNNKRGPDNGFENENNSKKPKYNDSADNNRVHTGWSDEENNGESGNRNGRGHNDSVRRIPSGWSDDESDQKSRSNDRKRFGDNNRGSFNRGGNFQRGGRGRGRGRGFGNRSPRNNNNYRNGSARSVPVSSGWSDDEDDAKNRVKIEPKIEKQTKSDDGWGDDNNDTKPTQNRTATPTNDDAGDWD